MKRQIFLLLVFYIYSNSLLSQNTFNKQYHFEWPAVVGNSMHITDSCYYISGLVIDSLPPYNEGLIFGKLDLEGNILHHNSIFSSDRTFSNWLTPLVYSDDGYFISMGYGVDTIGRYNYWMKLTEQGILVDTNYLRSYYFPEETSTGMSDFFQHPQTKEYYVLSDAFISDYDLGLTPGYNFVLTKLSEQGDSIFSIAFEHTFSYYPKRALLANNGEIIIGVQKTNSNLTRINLEYYSKIFAVDTLGQVLWQWQSPHSVQQGANDMLATDDGGLVVVSGRGFLEEVNPQTNRVVIDKALIFKLNSAHEMEWETEFTYPYPSGHLYNVLTQLIKTEDGSGYVAAGTQVDLYGEEPGGTILGWLAKVNPQGDSLWSRKLFYYEYPDSLEYEHEIHDLHATPDGGYIMSGRTLDREGISRPVSQAWYIKVDSEGCLIPGCGVVGTREPDREGPPLLLYPNPTTDYLNVYMGDTGGKEWSFVIYNSLGQQMGTYRAHSAHTTYMIDVGHWPSGQYFLRVSDSAGVEMRSYGFFRD